MICKETAFFVRIHKPFVNGFIYRNKRNLITLQIFTIKNILPIFAAVSDYQLKYIKYISEEDNPQEF